MIRFVCIDVDGTLLGASGSVHPRVWPALERAREAGIQLAICSGRPSFGATRAIADGVDSEGWHCFQNGASVVHLGSRRSRSVAVAPETLAMLIDRARRLGRTLELYTDDDYVTESAAERAQRHASLLGVPYAHGAFESLAGPVVRAQWLVPREEGPALLAEPHPGLEVSPSLAPTMPDTLFVNLTRVGVNKGLAVRAMADEYGIALEEVMYVGDGFNDTPAMRIVGCPVAMANAEPVARELASRSVGHVEDGGLADALDLAVNGSR